MADHTNRLNEDSGNAEQDEFEAFTAEDLDRLASEDVGARRRSSRRSQPPVRHRRDRNHTLEHLIRTELKGLGHKAQFEGEDLYVDGHIIGKNVRKRIARGGKWYDATASTLDLAEFVRLFTPDLIRLEAKPRVKAFDKRLRVRSAKRCAEVVRGKDEVLARITPRAFTTRGGEQCRGDFFAPGDHWDDALDLLRPRERRRNRSAPPTDPRETEARTTEGSLRAHQPSVAHPETQRRPDPEPERHKWPAEAAEELTTVACEASNALSEHRRRADDHRVELQCSSSVEVILSPVRVSKHVWVLPFRLSAAGGRMTGVIYLKSPNRPLTIGLIEHDQGVDLASGWATVLQVAARRLAGDDDDKTEGGTEPAGFHPDRATREITEHMVAGHKRRLPEGHRATADQIKLAEEHGIELAVGETWVKSHSKGSPPDGVLRYEWRGPRLSLTR